MKDVKTDPKMREASEAGQKPPTDANATRQRYQMGCHPEGQSGRAPTKSRQFNRGSGGGSRSRGGGGGY